MNRNLSLVIVACAAACGLALAQATQKPDAAAQIAALQKRVDALESELAQLKTVTPGTSEFEAGIAKDHQALENVLKYTAATASAAEHLDAVLDDSQAKGFTYGINPDSRIVMLQGFHEFTAALKTNAPKPEPVEPPKSTAKH